MKFLLHLLGNELDDPRPEVVVVVGVPDEGSSVVSKMHDPIHYCYHLQCYHLVLYYCQADARVQESAVVEGGGGGGGDGGGGMGRGWGPKPIGALRYRYLPDGRRKVVIFDDSSSTES